MSFRKSPLLSTAVSLIALCTLQGCSTTQNAFLGSTEPVTAEAFNAANYEEAMRRAADAKAADNYEEAASNYMHASEYEPDKAEPLMALAEVLWLQKKGNEAAKVLEHARKIDGGNVDVLRNLGKAYVTLNKPEEAKRAYLAALAIAPEDTRILNGLGVACDIVGDHLAAISHYKAGLTLAPHDISLKNNLAYSLITAERYDEAIKLLEPLALAKEATTRQRSNLALAYGLSGQDDEARSVLEKDFAPAQIERNITTYKQMRGEPDKSTSLTEVGRPTIERTVAVAQTEDGAAKKETLEEPEKAEQASKEAPLDVVAKADQILTPPPAHNETPVDIKPIAEQPTSSSDISGVPEGSQLIRPDGTKPLIAPEQPVAELSKPEGEVILAQQGSGPVTSAPSLAPVPPADSKTLAQIAMETASNTLPVPAPEPGKQLSATAPTKAEGMIERMFPQTQGAAIAKNSTASLSVSDAASLTQEEALARVVPQPRAELVAPPVVAPQLVTPPVPAETNAVVPAPAPVQETVQAPQLTPAVAVASAPKEPQMGTSLGVPASLSSVPGLIGSRIYLGRFESEPAAREAWIRIWTDNSAVLSNAVASIEPNNGKVALYAVGASSKDNADSVCTALRRNGVSCGVAK